MFAPPCQVKQTGQEPVRAPEKAHSAKELVPPRVAKPIVKSRGLSQRETIKSIFVLKKANRAKMIVKFVEKNIRRGQTIEDMEDG